MNEEMIDIYYPEDNISIRISKKEFVKNLVCWCIDNDKLTFDLDLELITLELVKDYEHNTGWLFFKEELTEFIKQNKINDVK